MAGTLTKARDGARGRAPATRRRPWLGLALAAGTAGATFGAASCSDRSASVADAGTGGGGEDAAGGAGGAAAVSIPVMDAVGIGSIGSTGWANTGEATAQFNWSVVPVARVTLIVDLATTCYPFERWATNPPPTGQNWPADCDAFDRNFDVFIDGGGPLGPLVEYNVMHAITPFGGPEHQEIDVTDLANLLPGAHQLRVSLQSYPDTTGQVTGSNGGWTVSARFEVTAGPAPREVLMAVPLTQATLHDGDPMPGTSFEIPAGAVAGRLEYRASGHGQGMADAGCTGPAEEFCDRRHHVFIDDLEIENVRLLRTDCGTLCTLAHYGPADAGFDYCQENPCGAIDSVRASRANWCPGSMTAPEVWDDVPVLGTPGVHTFSAMVSHILPGGWWYVSATYYAYGPPPSP